MHKNSQVRLKHFKLSAAEETANKHALRLTDALMHLSNFFPASQEKLDNISENDFLYLELLTSRFAKLQNYLENNVFEAVFDAKNEDADSLTIIDKLNKLEKLGIITDAHEWRAMRVASNIVAHEYPDNQKLIADTLNQIQGYCPILLDIKNRIFKALQGS